MPVKVCSKKQFCFTKLFYPEGERIVRCSLDKWEQDLSKNFSLLLSSEINDDWNYQLLLLTNQSSLLSAYLGQNELAYKICHGAISYFMNNSKKDRYIEGIFQPWINIGRLHIVEKNFEQAHKVFDNISPFLENYNINQYCINKSLLSKDTLLLLENCFFYEKIKIYINDNRNIESLFIFCNTNKKFSKYSELFLESKVVALTIMGDYLKAFDTIANSVKFIHENYLPIFILRLVDLSLTLKQPLEKITPLIMNLFDQHIDHVQVLNLQGLLFCLEICKRLKSIGENNYSLKMITLLIERFEKMNEEAALIESLNLEKESSAEYEEKFNLLINGTKYAFLKKKFLNQDVSYSFPLGDKLVSFLNMEI